MKKAAWILIFTMLIAVFSGCSQADSADIAATTLPVYQFTSMLVKNTGLTVTRLVTESVSCLHDYSLNVNQVKAAEAAKLVVVNGAGLEDFMSDLLMKKDVIDASEGIALLESCTGSEHTNHSHEADPHIWLSITNAKAMAKNIYYGLCAAYPEHQNVITANMTALMHQLEALDAYAQNKLKDLSCREMITFHDGFAYFAQDMGLTILATVEEESGSEASSQELIALIELVRQHNIPGIFMEENGSDSAAKTISVETGVNLYILNMAMSGEDYFTAMYHNIDTLWEALR